MKLLHKINKISLITTLILYGAVVTIYLAMMAQIALGFIQIMLAIAVTRIYYGELPNRLRNLLHIYWISAITNGVTIGWLTNTDHYVFSNAITVAAYFIAPICIAAYFVYVTYKIKKHLNKQS
ncbi:hypothetical protein [Flavobacterium rivuli]|nr:hypothetical protein [Flavobacterium rivuli]